LFASSRFRRPRSSFSIRRFISDGGDDGSPTSNGSNSRPLQSSPQQSRPRIVLDDDDDMNLVLPKPRAFVLDDDDIVLPKKSIVLDDSDEDLPIARKPGGDAKPAIGDDI